MSADTLEAPTTTATATKSPVITVYSKPACVQCDATYRPIERAGLIEGVEYVSIDVTQDPEAERFVRGLGYLQAPVVVFGDEHWGGFRPDPLKAAISAVLAARETRELAAA